MVWYLCSIIQFLPPETRWYSYKFLTDTLWFSKCGVQTSCVSISTTNAKSSHLLSQSVQAAIAKYYRLAGLKYWNLLLTGLETSTGLVKALFLVCKWPSSHCVLTLLRPKRERERKLSYSYYKGTNPIQGVPLSWPNYLLKVPYPNTITLGFRFLHMNFGKTHTFSPYHLLNHKLWEWSPDTYVVTNPRGDCFAHPSCENTGLDWQADFSNSCLLVSLSHSQVVQLPWESQAVRTCQTSKDVAFKILRVRWVLLSWKSVGSRSGDESCPFQTHWWMSPGLHLPGKDLSLLNLQFPPLNCPYLEITVLNKHLIQNNKHIEMCTNIITFHKPMSSLCRSRNRI